MDVILFLANCAVVLVFALSITGAVLLVIALTQK